MLTYYRIDAQVQFAASTAAVGTAYSISVIANGTSVAAGDFRAEAAVSAFRSVQVHTVVSLSSGQTLSVQAFQNTGSALALSGTAIDNYLSINRVP